MLRWLVVAALLFCSPAYASSLSVAPVLLEVTAPGAAAVLTLRNDQTRPVNVQVRVFRWEQVDGEDRLTPTRDVVVSPPMTALHPGTDQVVRVLRVSKRPVAGEESYRVVVDELPDAAERRNGRVKIVLRYSIPVFFAERSLVPARINWSLVQRGGGWSLEAVNTGGRRLRVANLALEGTAGKRIAEQTGLVGYVLPGASMRWPLSTPRGVKTSRTVEVRADTETGPIHATALVRAGR